MAEARPYDLSVCYDRSPLAGRRVAGSELVRVYPIDATPRGARLAIGAQRCPDGLSLGLTFSTAVAREPAEVLEAFETASAEFVDAARTTRPPATLPSGGPPWVRRGAGAAAVDPSRAAHLRPSTCRTS